MPVVQRPAAAPRGVHRRPAAASELPQGVAAASSPAAQPPERDAAESYLVSVVGQASENEARKYETKKHTKMEAEFKRTTVEQAQAISRGTGVCEKKKPPGRIHGRPPRPRPFNAEARSMSTNRTQAPQSNIA